jgi:hypothetical protein
MRRIGPIVGVEPKLNVVVSLMAHQGLELDGGLTPKSARIENQVPMPDSHGFRTIREGCRCRAVEHNEGETSYPSLENRWDPSYLKKLNGLDSVCPLSAFLVKCPSDYVTK